MINDHFDKKSFPCPWSYGIINFIKDEKEEVEYYICPICKRRITLEGLAEAKKKEEET